MSTQANALLRRAAWCMIGVVCLLLIACTSASRRVSRETPATSAAGTTAPATTPFQTGISPAASQYLTRALNFIQANSIMVALHRVDWPALREEAVALAQNEHARTTEQTYPAIRLALTGLGDHHSNLRAAQTVLEGAQGSGSGEPVGRRLPGGIGYLSLPQLFAFTATDIARQYILTARQLIPQIDSSRTCGWIIDLRYNGGGNMWPMLVAVGPILGQGRVGAFVDAAGQRTTWRYEDGRALLGDSVAAESGGPAYRLKQPMPPVALLFDYGTMSAAEAIVVAFQGRPNMRSFGQPTYGVPTSNITKTLSDGAVLAVTNAFEVDRTGRVYATSIAPEQPVADIYTSSGDLTSPDEGLHAAYGWLRTQPACESLAG